MLGLYLLATLLTWAALVAIGEAAARLVFGKRSSLVLSTLRLPLGLSTTICILEGGGYFLPIRIVAWLLVPIAAYGATVLAADLRRGRPIERSVLGATLVASIVGSVPVAVARRFTAAALTNNDGTYYITAADRLLTTRWAATYEVRDGVIPIDQCLIERVLHWWDWRTGTPNLMAAITALSGLPSTKTLTIVTVLLFACVPAPAIALARRLGVPARSARELLAGVVATCSAAPVFVGFQHMTGHLAACSLFPLTLMSLHSAARRGGWRRYFVTALFTVASVAFFADGGAVLVVFTVAVAIAVRPLLRTLVRMFFAGLTTAAIGPFTVWRAVGAALKTSVRVSRHQTIFLQRGWLPRGPLDNLATLLGVDPWPPWPALWPLNASTVASWLGTISGLVLFGTGLLCLRRRGGERLAALVLCSLTLLSLAVLDVHYLSGKILLMGAAFAVPVCAVGALTNVRSRARYLLVPFLLSELSALAYVAAPSRWKVVDAPAHDALVPELRRLPPSSLLAFDGLGAPADTVLDAQRAYRAALLAFAIPIDPGLDGGFYRPRCETAERPDPLPARAYALQRVTSENVTEGSQLSAWGDFRLLEVNLGKPDSFVASWAPTHGWIAAEREPDGRVFRWAEAEAQGTLQVVGPSPCVELGGELRLVHGAGQAAIRADDRQVFLEQVTGEWTKFTTKPFIAMDPVTLLVTVLGSLPPPPDPAHAVALSRLSLRNAPTCGARFTRGSERTPLVLPVDFDRELQLSMVSPETGACVDVVLNVEGPVGATVGLSIDGGAPAVEFMKGREVTITARGVKTTGPHELRANPVGGAPNTAWRLKELTVAPRKCPD